MATRKELTEAVGARYRQARARERTTILDEFVALTGYHRKHAIRVLAGVHPHERPRDPRNRFYDEAVRQTLIVLWEAGDRVCGKRLVGAGSNMLSFGRFQNAEEFAAALT